MTLASRPDTGESTIITSPAGMTMRLAAMSERPRPAPVSTGSSRICGNTTFDANSAKPMPIDARLVSSTGRRAATRRSSSGSAMRSSYHPQTSSTTTPPRLRPRVGRRRPAPLAAARDGDQDAGEPDREARRADEVEAAGGAQHAHRDDPQHEGEADRPEPGSDPEQEVPVGELGHERADRQSERTADTERGADQRDRAVDAVGVQHVAQDRDAERNHADHGALQRPADEHAEETRRAARRSPSRG